MKNIIQSITVFLFFGQVSFAQDTIPISYDTDFLIWENGIYTFYDSIGHALSPGFKTEPCNYPLSIDGDMCYLGMYEEFECQVNGKWGLMTRKGEVTLSFDFDAVMSSYSRVFVEKNELWYEIERIDDSEESYNMTQLDCDFVTWNYRMGLLLVKGDQVFFLPEKGIISETPKKEPEYGYIEIKQGCKYGVATAGGKVLFPIIYEDIKLSKEGIRLYDGEKYGFYCSEKQETTKLKYDGINSGTRDGFLVYEMGSKKGLMRTSGEEMTEPIYQTIYAFGDSLMQVEKNDKWGFIDINGQEVIPCIYDGVDGFKNGLAGAKVDGKWGFINSIGEVEIPFQFSGGPMGLYFREYDKAKIKRGGACYYINRKGELLEKCSCR